MEPKLPEDIKILEDESRPNNPINLLTKTVEDVKRLIRISKHPEEKTGSYGKSARNSHIPETPERLTEQEKLEDTRSRRRETSYKPEKLTGEKDCKIRKKICRKGHIHKP